MPTDFDITFSYFQINAVRHVDVTSWAECQGFFRTSTYKDWIYLIRFKNRLTNATYTTESDLMSKAADIYAWGTASDLGQRLRKASVFHQKLSGKYDRRVDYLMLKMIFDLHSVHLFECKNNAISIEQSRRTAIYGATAKGACIRGLINSTRAAIATEIYEMFKTTSHYQNNLNAIERKLFDEFVFSFWLAKLKHPTNPARTFYYGDCLEPGFIHRTLARPDLIPVIEKALNVKF